ncbi:MAG: ABC transporter substrate-binding protein [Theionarchaea archaeon]|nr:ABC transporter substrate-binding protein [Theionarchaea archaeon]MBU7000479.1 ABC transporter substrate-binding protein [Theionarchaea archaeon]MBU7019994.1 ABC transporter substrate-binding protein [Theionarchaea archaeon]MBU7035245.1 ABC transporter substrate-binding protein [Theionarchaea archaeon]MBU7040564.1 ABC transporter substrate-binding protein [Theionarchaea archaeon]
MKKISCLLLVILMMGCLSQQERGIQSIDDLNGKTIAIPGKATVQDFLLQRFLKDNNITATTVIVKPPEMIQTLESGGIDAFIAWEPYPGRAVVEGGHSLLVTSQDIWPHHPCCVVAVREEFLAEDRDVVLAVLACHMRATTFILENPQEAVRIGVDFTGMSEEVISQAMQTIEYVYEPNYSGIKEYLDQLLDMEYVNPSDVGEVDTFLSKFINSQLIEEAATYSCSNLDKTIRIGYLRADLHQLALFVALDQGYFDEFGLTVELYVFSAGPEEMDAFGSQDIDMGYLGIAPATTKRLNLGIPIVILAGVNNEGSALVVS